MRDWRRIESAVEDLEELIHFLSLDGNHLLVLDEIRRVTALLYAAGVARGKCAALVMAARDFYRDAAGRARPADELRAAHQRLLGYVSSIHSRVRTLKQSELN